MRESDSVGNHEKFLSPVGVYRACPTFLWRGLWTGEFCKRKSKLMTLQVQRQFVFEEIV